MGFFSFLGDAAGAVERQVNVLDDNKTAKNKKGSNSGKSVATQAKNLGWSFLKPIVQLPIQASENYSNTFANLGNRLGGGKNQTIEQNMGGTPVLDKTLKFSGATGKNVQVASDAGQVALSFLAPVASKVIAPVAERLLAPTVAKLATGTLSGAATGAPVSAAAEAGNPGADIHSIIKAAELGAAGGAGLGFLGAGGAAAVENHIPLNQVGSIGKNVTEQDVHIPVGETSFIRISQEELNKLSKAASPDEVKAIIGDGLPQNVVDRIAPAIATVKDPNIVKNVLAQSMHEPSVAELSGQRPHAELQTAIENAHNAGDTKQVVQLITQLPVEEQPAMLSALGIIKNPEPTPVVTKSAAAEPPADAFKEITDAVNGKGGAAAARKQQNQVLSAERGQRFAASEARGTEADGSIGYFKEKSALKGKYTQTNFKPLINDIGPERAEELFTGARRQIKAIPDEAYHEMGLHPGGARLNTQTAVRKVLGLEPGIPTDSEIKLLKVVSPKIAAEAQKARPRYHQLMDFAAKIFGSIRGIKSTADFSMGGRQGLFVAARHPLQWAEANKESVKYAKSGKYYKEQMRNISNDDWVRLGDEHGLALPASVLGKEEQYAGSDLLTGDLAKNKLKIGNVIAGSERAYDGGLTRLRASLWKHNLQAFGDSPEAAAQALGQKGLEGLAETINTLTGRGGKKGGLVTKHINTLAETLFSPRLWASRLEPLNPVFWKRIGPAGRREAIQSLASFAGVASLVLEAAHAAGADVETDPRSSDFLKIKVGDTRYDILGGFQQNLVFGWREISGEKKSSTSGEVKKFAKGIPDLFKDNPLPVDNGFGSTNRLKIASDLAGNKLNPVLASGVKIVRGTDAGGQPTNPYTEIGQLFVPISAQGSYQTIKDVGSVPEGLLRNAPDFVGIGSQTYGTKDINVSKKQGEYIDKLKKDKAPQDKIDATKLFFQTIKTVPSKDGTYKLIDQALAHGDEAAATKIANDYNTKYDAAFKDWRKQYGSKYSDDEVLSDSFSSRLITDDQFQGRIDKASTK